MGVTANRTIANGVRVCVIYCRVSSPDEEGNQQEDSLKEQERVGRDRAYSLGYRDNEITICNERFTGEMLWEREELAAVRKKIAAGEVSCFIVKKLDRLARDPIHQAIVIRETIKRGCAMEIILEPLDGSAEGELIRYVKGYASSIELAAIKERCQSGKMARRRQGKRSMARVPYGYDRDRERATLVINPEEARWIERMFDWAVAGQGICWITTELNRLQVTPPGAKLNYKKIAKPIHWQRSTVSKMIRNPLYKGEDYWGKTKSQGLRENGRSYMRPAPKEEWMPVQSNIPPIVSESNWATAQASVIEKRSSMANFTKNQDIPVLLRGMVTCKQCGARVIRTSTWAATKPTTGEGKRYWYYRCSSRVTGKAGATRLACKSKMVNADWLNNLVWSKVTSMVSDPEGVRTALKGRRTDGSRDVLAGDLDTLEADATKERRQASAIAGRLAHAITEDDSILIDVFESKLTEIKLRLKLIDTQVTECRTRLAAYEQSDKSADAFEAMLAKAAGILSGAKGPVPFSVKRLALELLGAEVVLDGHDASASFSTVDHYATPGSCSSATPTNCIRLNFRLS